MSPPQSGEAPCGSSECEMLEKPDDVVITGMSGHFPESLNVYELRDNLMNKVDMITDDNRRWDLDHSEIPHRTGKVENLSKFDASFFAVHYKQATCMDPMCRILLELAYEAVVDAGVNPMSLRGTRTGVFIGACFSESEKIWFYDQIMSHGFGITGCSRAMLANRISYYLDIHGPSYSMDTACSSGMYALNNALKAIRSGECDAALVGGANLLLHPFISLQFARLGVLSKDGMCKSFDANADGYCRSEALVMIFLQKAKDAKRIYASVVHTKTNCDGFKEQGITYPSGVMQGNLLKEIYQEAGISPAQLAYFEAHGTGTKVGDPEELNTIDRVLCKERTEPLLVGSIKSNLGHSEAASAISAVIKVVIGMETGLIPPNIHYHNPRAGVPAIPEGRIKVVTEPTPWEGGYVGVSSYGFGGANGHTVLRSNSRKKPAVDPAVKDGLPRLIVASGRTEEAVDVILSEFESKPLDSEYVALLHEVQSEPISGHIYRGYSVLHANPTKGNEPKLRDLQQFQGAKRSLWFVFAGMGSQWPGMGRDLLKLPVFARAIDQCDVVLKPRGLDIKNIITNEDPKLFDNILNAFVGIAAIQVGLVDVLTEIGIVPDGIVGHSVGELGCAYADGCFSAEQMVLAAYSRGLASLETPLIHGSMAAVGLNHEDAALLCPPDVEVACHNGTDSCTISGPADSVAAFVAELKQKGIFAREVACSNIAYHSRYIAKAGPRLLKYLREVIPQPRERSEKWVSSSVHESNWEETDAMLSSAEYHTNNLLRPVLFAEALHHVPKDAITIEIAPHGLLQAILRRTLSKETTNVALTQRGTKSGLDMLFQSFGKLYMVGLQPQISKLYPPVQFPVSRGTPMLSPLVRWQHQDDFHVASFKHEETLETGERTVQISVKEEGSEFYIGHNIDGRNLFPATGYMYLAWETLAMMNSKVCSDMPVVFENVKFLRACTLPKDGHLKLTIMVTKGTGTFEVVEGGSTVVTGRLYVPEDVNKEFLNLPSPRVETTLCTAHPLAASDVYKELRLRGYNYSGLFKSIRQLDATGTVGKIRWENNYIAFIDTLLQSQILQMDSRALYVPTALEKMVIDPHRHQDLMRDLQEKDFPLYVHEYHNMLHSGGIEVRGMQCSVIPRRKYGADPVLETYAPLAYRPSESLPADVALRALTHIVLENILNPMPKVAEWVSPVEENMNILLGPKILNIFGDLPLVNAQVHLVGANTTLAEILKTKTECGVIPEERPKLAPDAGNHLLLVGDGESLMAVKEPATEAVASLTPGGFLLMRVRMGYKHAACMALESLGTTVVSEMAINTWEIEYVENDCKNEKSGIFILARKLEQPPPLTSLSSEVVTICVNGAEAEDLTFSWVTELKTALMSDPTPRRVYLVSQNESRSGLLGFVNALCQEYAVNIVRCVIIMDSAAPDFNPSDPFYTPQLKLDFIMNYLPADGQGWSSYRHFLLQCGTTVAPHAYVNVLTRGDLSSFRWIQGPITNISEPVQGYQHLYHVYFSSINFRDVMLATGKLATDITKQRKEYVQGLEFSGREPSGRRVMGLATSGAQSNVILSDPVLIWDVPEKWTLEEAATIPVVYSTVYYGLIVKGRMQRGESILIHAGSGGVGQAAINVALHMNCTIYVTVGTAEKKSFINKAFPQIPDANIGNSRDTSFEQLIMERTKGKGVDLVLNSLAGDKLQASLRCLCNHGRFIEIGKVDMTSDSSLGMKIFLKDTSFHGVLLDMIIDGTDSEKRQLKELLSNAIKSGAVKPLVRTVFRHDQVETAFRFMAAGKHIGKVLLRIRDEETDGTPKGKPIMVKPIHKEVEAMPRFYCDPRKTYIIIGGLGGFGLELADWLVHRGARKLILSSRTGIKNGYQGFRIRSWERYGATIVVSTAEVTCEQGCITLLEMASKKLGPVAAIFNLAVVIKDALFENQQAEDFAVAFMPKARTTALLDEVSRRVCPQLQHFIVFSSVACGRGNVGQTNYAYANSVMERICEERRAAGLPAMAIQWGAIGEVGIVAEKMELYSKPDVDNKDCSTSLDDKVLKTEFSAAPLVIGGTLQQRVASCLTALDVFLTLPEQPPVVASMVVAEKANRHNGSGSLVDSVVNILGIKDIKTVSQHSTLAELGMDSMMAVEIKQTLEREFELNLPPQDIRTLTFAKLQEIALKTQENNTVREDAQNTDSQQTDQWLIGGIQHFLGVIGSSESASQSVVKLPSERTEGSQTVFMVPGVEGLAWVMEPLAKQLNYPVCCLQLPLDTPSHNVEELAYILTERLLSQQSSGPYLLLGYSYGTAIVVEMAWQLETKGQEVRILLVDGAPEALQGMAKRDLLLNSAPEAEWQSAFLSKLLTDIGYVEAAEVHKELLELPDWDARLARAALHFPAESERLFHAKCVNAVQKRVTALMKYSWPANRKIHCPVTLVRTAVKIEGARDDYGLSQICKHKVSVHEVESTHSSIITCKNTAEIINALAFV